MDYTETQYRNIRNSSYKVNSLYKTVSDQNFTDESRYLHKTSNTMPALSNSPMLDRKIDFSGGLNCFIKY